MCSKDHNRINSISSTTTPSLIDPLVSAMPSAATPELLHNKARRPTRTSGVNDQDENRSTCSATVTSASSASSSSSSRPKKSMKSRQRAPPVARTNSRRGRAGSLQRSKSTRSLRASSRSASSSSPAIAMVDMITPRQAGELRRTNSINGSKSKVVAPSSVTATATANANDNSKSNLLALGEMKELLKQHRPTGQESATNFKAGTPPPRVLHRAVSEKVLKVFHADDDGHATQQGDCAADDSDIMSAQELAELLEASRHRRTSACNSAETKDRDQTAAKQQQQVNKKRQQQQQQQQKVSAASSVTSPPSGCCDLISPEQVEELWQDCRAAAAQLNAGGPQRRRSRRLSTNDRAKRVVQVQTPATATTSGGNKTSSGKTNSGKTNSGKTSSSKTNSKGTRAKRVVARRCQAATDDQSNKPLHVDAPEDDLMTVDMLEELWKKHCPTIREEEELDDAMTLGSEATTGSSSTAKTISGRDLISPDQVEELWKRCGQQHRRSSARRSSTASQPGRVPPQKQKKNKKKSPGPGPVPGGPAHRDASEDGLMTVAMLEELWKKHCPTVREDGSDDCATAVTTGTSNTNDTNDDSGSDAARKASFTKDILALAEKVWKKRRSWVRQMKFRTRLANPNAARPIPEDDDISDDEEEEEENRDYGDEPSTMEFTMDDDSGFFMDSISCCSATEDCSDLSTTMHSAASGDSSSKQRRRGNPPPKHVNFDYAVDQEQPINWRQQMQLQQQRLSNSSLMSTVTTGSGNAGDTPSYAQLNIRVAGSVRATAAN